MGKIEELGQKAVELAKTFDESFLELGKTLWRLQEIGEVEDFRRVCKTADLGTRKAYYLASIAKLINGLHIPTKRLRAIGWTKLMTISPHLTKQNWKELLTLAETNKNRDLQMLVKGEKVEKTQHCVLLYLSKSDYLDFVKSALRHGAARSGRGLLHKEQALMALVRKDLEEYRATTTKPAIKPAKKKVLVQ
ncbi:MAG: hypothetical protein ABWX70_06155 [Hyphomicrobium sp.]